MLFRSFKNDKVISKFKNDRILKNPYQDQVKETGTDISQNVHLEEEVSTKTNLIEESEPETITDLREKDKGKKRVNELSEIDKPRVSFSSTLEASSYTL